MRKIYKFFVPFLEKFFSEKKFCSKTFAPTCKKSCARLIINRETKRKERKKVKKHREKEKKGVRKIDKPEARKQNDSGRDERECEGRGKGHDEVEPALVHAAVLSPCIWQGDLVQHSVYFKLNLGVHFLKKEGSGSGSKLHMLIKYDLSKQFFENLIIFTQ